VSADHVPKENMNKYFGSSWLHSDQIGKRLNLKRSALRISNKKKKKK